MKLGNPLYVVCMSSEQSFYGLWQAPGVWFDKLKAFLQSIGFKLSKSNASLFVRITNLSRIYVLVFIDDIIIMGDSNSEIDGFASQLHIAFSLKDIGFLHYFLGTEVTRLSNGGLLIASERTLIQYRFLSFASIRVEL